MDIQPVFNYHRCVTYLCSYLSKAETQCSQAVQTSAKEARMQNLDNGDTLRKIGAAFLSSRAVSSQECVYRCLPKLWLRRTFPATVFVTTELPNDRIKMRKNDKQFAELHDDSTDIFYSNIIERYADRPNAQINSGIYTQVDNMCLAEFAAYYYKPYKCDSDEQNDNQPNILPDDFLENQTCQIPVGFPQTIKLMTKNETMKCRKVKAIIRVHKPQKALNPEKYFHHLLMLCLPWRNETDLIGHVGTYASKFSACT